MGPLEWLTIGGKIIDKIIPDPKAKAEAQLSLLQLQQSGELAKMSNETQLQLAQIEVNKIDAASGKFFQYGWRPFIGWICGFALAYEFLFRVIFGYIARNLWHWDTMPELDTGDLFTLLGGILGLGALRTTEKLKGKA